MRSVEIFAGCGGLALGISRAEFKHDVIIERDEDCIRTLSENKKRKLKFIDNWNISQSDTRKIEFTDFEGTDLVSGGPPCQPFSIGGKHLGPQDARNMWPEAIRAVREIRPKAFIFENVRGLFRPTFSDYLEYIKLQLSFPNLTAGEETWEKHLARLRECALSNSGRKDYRVIARAINAADYGAPQKRHRAIIVGISSDFGDNWEFPAATHSQEALAWAKHVDGDYWKRHGLSAIREPSSAREAYALKRILGSNEKPKKQPWVTVRDAIGNLSAPTKDQKLTGHWQHPGARAYPNHTGSNLDEPAKALKAGDHGVPGGENMLADPEGRVRYFTIREMARLQTLPDDFVVSGSWKAATRQLGNAVPAIIAEQIGKAVRAIIETKLPSAV